MNRLKWSSWSCKVSMIFLALLLLATPVLGAKPFSDVPEWAYQSVKKLVDGGYLELYEDGTFRGNNSVDRYTLATIIAKILVNIGEGTPSAGKEDVALLRKLSNEFQNELVLLTVKNKELEERLVKIEESKMILAEDQTKTTSGMKLLSDELQKEVGKIATDILNEKRRLDALESEFESLKTSQSQEIEKLRIQIKKEQRTNRILILILGVLGVAGIFLPAAP